MDICQHFPALYEVSWICFDSFENTHSLLNIIWLNSDESICQQHMHFFICAGELRDSLGHYLLRLLGFFVLHVALGQQQINWASIFFWETQNSKLFGGIIKDFSFHGRKDYRLAHCFFGGDVILHFVLYLSFDQHKKGVLSNFKANGDGLLKAVHGCFKISLFVSDHSLDDWGFFISGIHIKDLSYSHTGFQLIPYS